jgi:hypothetical protein
MSSIIRARETYHGISVFGRGVFTHEFDGGWTYAGQCKDGYACGLGVLTWSSGANQYAEHGPDGQWDGRYLFHFPSGCTEYRLFERGNAKDFALVFADGRCECNGEDCAPDDPRLLALIAQVAPVEVRPRSPSPPPATRPPLAPKQSSEWISRLVLPPAGAREDHCRRGEPPRRTPALVAVRHNPMIPAVT